MNKNLILPALLFIIFATPVLAETQLNVPALPNAKIFVDEKSMEKSGNTVTLNVRIDQSADPGCLPSKTICLVKAKTTQGKFKFFCDGTVLPIKGTISTTDNDTITVDESRGRNTMKVGTPMYYVGLQMCNAK